jgi:hypothetical protein
MGERTNPIFAPQCSAVRFIRVTKSTFHVCHAWRLASVHLAIQACAASLRISGTILVFLVTNTLAFIVVVADDVHLGTVSRVQIAGAVIVNATLVTLAVVAFCLAFRAALFV